VEWHCLRRERADTDAANIHHAGRVHRTAARWEPVVPQDQGDLLPEDETPDQWKLHRALSHRLNKKAFFNDNAGFK